VPFYSLSDILSMLGVVYKKGKRAMNLRRIFSLGAALSISCVISCGLNAQSKEHVATGTNIVIDAKPEVVFEAIRKQRNNAESHRHLESFDGKVAIIKENMENVPLCGKVECFFEETEHPYTRIDYKMLRSSKFKAGFGSWILTPSADGKSTTLEFDSYTDAGLMIPFAGEFTKSQSMDNAKKRLKHIKEVSEQMQKEAPADKAK
jgi:hypothetical protein